MALSLRHVADQLFSEVRLVKEQHGHCKYCLSYVLFRAANSQAAAGPERKYLICRPNTEYLIYAYMNVLFATFPLIKIIWCLFLISVTDEVLSA